MSSLFGSSTAAPGASATPAFGRSSSFTSGETAKPSFSFGGAAQPANNAAPPKPLFGTAPNTSAPSTSATPAPSTGLFGQNTAQPSTTQPAQSTGLFGQQNQAKPSLFGSQPQGGLFGASQPAQTSQPQGGGLFSASQPSQPAQTGGLFGAATTQPSQPQGGLFGASQPAQTSQPQGGLFGASTSNPAQGGLFGAKPASQGLFGAPSTQPQGGLLGASQPALSTSSQPTSALLQHGYYQRERFNELPDAQRNLLEEMDKYIRSQTQIKNELRARDQNSEPRRLPSEVHELSTLQQSLSASLEADVLRLQTIAARVERDRADHMQLHQIAQHAKDKLSDGSSFVDWLRHFYERAAEEDVARIHRYRVTMEQIERHLLSLEQREQFAPQVIAEVIYDQNASFMGLAEQIATLHAEIETLKKDYVKWYQARFQSVRDPFAPGVSVAEGA